jgi:hypothetical protein
VAEENEALFKEIDEELRQDKANEMWKAYGNYIIGGAVALILTVAGFQGWKTYDTNQRIARGEAFDAARVLSSGKKTEEAIAAFGKVADGNSDGYAQLARFREAGLLAQNGDQAAAISIYKTLSENDALTLQYRDLAVVLGAFQELNSSSGERGLIDRLGGLTDAKNPWRHSAREALAIVALKNGDRAKAREHYKTLADDAMTPRGLAQRAAEMLKTIGQ